MSVLLWFHLVAAAVWLGGLITLGALVGALRRAEANRDQLRAVARSFGRVSWTAMGTSVVTGVGLLLASNRSLDDTAYLTALLVKLLLVGLAVGVAVWHQLNAARQSARTRGILQVAILLVSLGVFAAAIAL